MTKLTVAANGICHAEWNSGFYPQDIPLDWKLAYFANEFPACLITPADLIELESPGHEFADMLPENFQLYLQIDHTGLPPLSDRFLARLSGIVVIPEKPVTGDLAAELRLLKLPVCLCLAENRLSDPVAEASNFNLPLCHRNTQDGDLHCRFISAAQASDLRHLKQLIAKWRADKIEHRVLFVDGGTDIELIRNVATLVQLLT